MRSSLYKLTRISALIFTIEWFYRLGATNKRVILVEVSMITLFIILSSFLFYRMRHGTGKRLFLYAHAGFVVLFFMMSGLYGYYRGGHELMVPPDAGQPIRTIGRVMSVHSTHGRQMVDLLLTRIEIFNQVKSCKISVSYSQGLRNSHELSTGQSVQLSGTIVSAEMGKGYSESPLLQLFSPSYHFVGRIERIWNSENTKGWISQFRGALHHSAVATCGQDEQSRVQETILESIVFGGNDVPKNLHTVFLQAGVLHILAASGANILFMERMVSRLFWVLGRMVPFGTYVAEIGVLVFIWFYTLLCDIQPSILRAAWMSSYRVLGRMAGRNVSTAPSLIFSGLCTALVNPGELWTISSVLSYVATFALDKAVRSLYQTHKQERINQKMFGLRSLAHFILTYMKKTIVTSTWVELYVGPLCAALFEQWTPYGVISNLFVEPILSILLPVTAIWFMFSFFSMHAPVFFAFNHLLTKVVFEILRLFMDVLTGISQFPFALVRLPALPVMVLLTYYLFLTMFKMTFCTIRNKQNRWTDTNLGLSM